MVIGPAVIAGGALLLWALNQKSSGLAPKANATPDGQIAQVTSLLTPKTTTFVSNVYDSIAKNPAVAILSGLSTFVGFAISLATISGIGIAAAGAYVALAVIVVVIAAVYITAGVTAEQWQKNSKLKGQQGLLDDYVTIGVALGHDLAQSMIDGGPPAGSTGDIQAAWPTIARIWASYYATNVLYGYNQVSQGVIAFFGGDPNNLFSDRAMFLRYEYISANRTATPAMKARIFAGVLAAGEQNLVANFNAQAQAQAEQWGMQFGRILWTQLFARGTMIEPWQHDWFTPTTLSGLGISSYSAGMATNLLAAGLFNSGSYGPSLQICNYDAAGNPQLTVQPWSHGPTGELQWGLFQTMKTVAPPFVVDWTLSTVDHIEMGASKNPTIAQLAQFGRFGGHMRFRQFGAAGTTGAVENNILDAFQQDTQAQTAPVYTRGAAGRPVQAGNPVGTGAGTGSGGFNMGLVLPLAAVAGVGAFLLFGKKKGAAGPLSGYSRRRRRRHHR